MTAILTDDACRIAETFASAGECVQIVSADGWLLWANAASDAVLGCAAGAIWTRLADHWPDIADELRDVLSQAPPAARYLTVRRPDATGVTCWWDLSLVPFADVEGGGYVLACRDVTERETRRLARDVLTEQTRLRQQTAAGLASSLMRLHAAPRDVLSGVARRTATGKD